MFFNKDNKDKAKCLCSNGTEYCDLILELRNLQEKANKQRALIEYYNNSKKTSLDNILRFIQKLKERAKFNYAGDISSLDIIDVICSCSAESIEVICHSIQSIKTYSYEVSNAECILDSLNEDIQNVKNKLGIE